MSIIDKKDDLISAIKNSEEYAEYNLARAALLEFPDQKNFLDEYKKLLLESQLGQFLGEGLSNESALELDEIYNEISQYEVINHYLMAEYKLKNMLSGIYQDLSHIIETKENRNNYYL